MRETFVRFSLKPKFIITKRYKHKMFLDEKAKEIIQMKIEEILKICPPKENNHINLLYIKKGLEKVK